ncbi:hypothetical protein [Viridibacillus arvi]|nr:hypothetical protein [Viridibacillus arvi]
MELAQQTDDLAQQTMEIAQQTTDIAQQSSQSIYIATIIYKSY